MAESTESGVMAGAASGATIGSMVAPGVGTVIGGVIGGALGYFTSDSARKKQRSALQKAEQAAEKSRREGIIRQMGAKQQADSLTMATMKSGSTPPKAASSTPSPGTVGPQINAAGTF